MFAWCTLATLLAGSLLSSAWTDSASAFSSFAEHRGGALLPQAANGSLNERPTILAHQLNGDAIVIDGRLDEAVWARAEAAGGFMQADPKRGDPPSQETVFKVAYDEDALYFAIACFETNPTAVSSALSRRDRIDNSDLVSFYLDPYLDRTTGYNFRVNPDGVQMDQYVFNDGEMDRDWDAVWEAETYRDSTGWYAELRIPFSSVRYRPAPEMTWGLQVYRWMHGRGEDTAWVNWERNAPGFVSRFGQLGGLRGIPAPRQLEIVPFVASRSTEPSINPSRDGLPDEVDNFQNFGADLKYGVTADLTLNATFQPDFGQVEADPATLNLSPFETFYEEKRPFFIEGSRFFEHPNFALVYTRRIGTGDENSRIRYAGKLTGKAAGGISVATMFAATDVAGEGQAHNFLKSGREQSYFAVARLGKEFKGGAHRFNVMQTGVWRNDTDRFEWDGARRGRDGFTTGTDGQLTFKERSYEVQGSWVYSMVDPTRAIYSDGNSDGAAAGSVVPGVNHSPRHGTGGNLRFQKLGGKYRGGIFNRFEHDKLEINDMGQLSAPDDASISLWFQRRYSFEEGSSYLNSGNVNVNLWRGWFYGDRVDPATGQSGRSGSYGRGKPQYVGGNINGFTENKHRWSLWYGLSHDWAGRDRYATRGGPIMQYPSESGMWVGMNSDWRKSLKFDGEIAVSAEHADNGMFTSLTPDQGYAMNLFTGMSWSQSSRFNHRLQFSFRRAREDDQWLSNVANPGSGIGGTSYVFARMDQRVSDVTLRSSVLFNRKQSLELYVQPFLAIGNFYDAKELADPDSYDFIPFSANGYEARDSDFKYTSVNLNAVYRWEYRPGSTFYLVWTHARGSYLDRGGWMAEGGDPFAFENDLDPDALFRNEPENTILLKLSYWLSI